ncbi:putative signal recognition particle-docking protein FtsY [Blattamonas nauphoetae]|uniref:Signal recognition particle-docking protein FtsY n=1 Tax=Blattamonas nauphoetae TaxID=2049346 RepID=A0ABQ9YF38_9EUKA|nr:putative signal recognition particle-docking protein FtsY [Blattamonas nauphoetae]
MSTDTTQDAEKASSTDQPTPINPDLNPETAVMPQDYVKLVTQSSTADFGLLHVCNPIYEAGRDYQGNRLFVIIPSSINERIPTQTVIQYFFNKIDAIKFEHYSLVVVCANLGFKGDPTKFWSLKLYRSMPYCLRKNLKHFFIVNPPFKFKFFMAFARPFLSSKFWKKLHFMTEVQDLFSFISPLQLQLPSVFSRPGQSISKPFFTFGGVEFEDLYKAEREILFGLPLPEDEFSPIEQSTKEPGLIASYNYVPLALLNGFAGLIGADGQSITKEGLFRIGPNAHQLEAAKAIIETDPLHIFPSDTPVHLFASLIKGFFRSFKTPFFDMAFQGSLQGLWGNIRRQMRTEESIDEKVKRAFGADAVKAEETAEPAPTAPTIPQTEITDEMRIGCLADMFLTLPTTKQSTMRLILSAFYTIGVKHVETTRMGPNSLSVVFTPCLLLATVPPDWMRDVLMFCVEQGNAIQQRMEEEMRKKGLNILPLGMDLSVRQRVDDARRFLWNKDATDFRAKNSDAELPEGSNDDDPLPTLRTALTTTFDFNTKQTSEPAKAPIQAEEQKKEEPQPSQNENVEQNEEKQKKEEEEHLRKEEEERKQKEEARIAKEKADEEERLKKQEETKQKEEEERRQKEEEERLAKEKAEEERKQKEEEERAAREKAEEEEKQKAEEERKQKEEEERIAKEKAEEEERVRKEEEERKQKEEEERIAKEKAEEEERLKKEEEERVRKEEEERKQKEEEERIAKEKAEEEERLKKEEEERRQKEEEERLAKEKAEEEERVRKEEEERKQKEEEERIAKEKAEEEERLKKEEEERRQKEEEERLAREKAEEEERVRKEEEERKQKEEEERKQKEEEERIAKEKADEEERLRKEEEERVRREEEERKQKEEDATETEEKASNAEGTEGGANEGE